MDRRRETPTRMAVESTESIPPAVSEPCRLGEYLSLSQDDIATVLKAADSGARPARRSIARGRTGHASPGRQRFAFEPTTTELLASRIVLAVE
jgi:hypothetical protein